MEYLAALVPSAGVVLLFWVAIRAMLRADRTERAAVARLDRERAGQTTRDAREPAAPEAPASRQVPDDGDRPTS